MDTIQKSEKDRKKLVWAKLSLYIGHFGIIDLPWAHTTLEATSVLKEALLLSDDWGLGTGARIRSHSSEL